MEAFFKDLEIKIQEAVKSEMPKILKNIGNEKIYAIALVTDHDCITLFLAVNTYEYMEKTDKKYIDSGYLSEEDIKRFKEGTGSLTKWMASEWGYSDENYSQFNDISKLLYDKEASISEIEYEDYDKEDEAYQKYKSLFFDTVTSAFKHLIEENVFGEHSEEITFFVSMTDDDMAMEIENHSAKLLNPKNVYEAFLKRYIL